PHTCGRKNSGALYCWGTNWFGELGQGTGPDVHTPTQVGADTDWTQIALGENMSCGIKGPGDLWCWGRNDWGQLGVDEAWKTSPTTVTF
ncbi:MAG: hypothetical protein KAI47_22480, partial [Deltaproteobacteria bacterium]|nr:hypothetical protein [Deltaproteobacteria bacterium]